MRTHDRFSSYSPVVIFIFFAAAIALCMFLLHPAYVAASCLMAAAYLLTIKGRRALRTLAVAAVVFALLTVLNPLLNTYGTHVLFTYLGGRPYTLEALYYGAATGGMFVSVMLWFSSYHVVMTSDKFLYLFGRVTPALSLLLTLILRLVPGFQRHLSQIAGARRCVGLAGDAGTRREKTEHGLMLLSSLTGWALEGAVITADSMRSRGYGCGRRTSFSLCRFDRRDRRLLLLQGLLLAGVLIPAVGCGVTAAAYTPFLSVAPLNTPAAWCGIAAYACFLSIPTLLNLTEAVTWRILKSRI